MRGVMKFYLIAALLLFYGSFEQSSANESEPVNYPVYENIYVNDYANAIDTELEGILSQHLQQAALNNGPQITLVIIQSLDEYLTEPAPSIEPFATGLFNHWGVGNAKSNDGVLILVSIRDRKMRIELGSGYSSYHDKVMKEVIESSFIPYFKGGDYPTGIKNGTIETIYQITGEYPGEIGKSFYARAKFKVLRWVDKLGPWILAIVLPINMLFFVGLRKIWRLRPRSCAACQSKMTMLGETADDEHIGGGQRLEEYLESVDYDVWQCGTCQRIDISRYTNPFTRHSTCKACNYRTLEADTTTVEFATTSSTGLKRIDYHCQNCDFEDTEMRTIARKSESSNSGGSSSSFGGGSSSGGGATGSW